ncbi:MAG TPA: RNA-binding protein [Firmicutes bacterium]|nr:RNA-binding protein [Bacillota bacterium]
MKTIYVGNLPWATTEDELASVFAEKTGCEIQASRIITDRETGRSRGFGFVEVADADLEKVLAAMQGVSIDGREIVVNEARARQGRA